MDPKKKSSPASPPGTAISGYTGPLGLEGLAPLGRVLVRQKTTLFAGNKYVVCDWDGEPLYYAKEDSNALSLLGTKSRPFDISVFNTNHQEVMTLRRPFTFGPDKMQVTVCGQLASVVRQEVTFVKPVLYINDAADRPVLRVKGPAITAAECEFKLETASKKQIGVIRRVWPGWGKLMVNTDHFHIVFPMDLDVRYKAAVIGTCFLIDFLYFEE